MLSHMTQLKYFIEYHFALSETFEEINYNEIEDLLSDTRLSSNGPRKYENPVELIRRLTDE